jgi:5-oxoprolinase (ATP-hydrolysing) subunit C
MSLRVLHPGTFSLLVDRGRPSSRSLGVPVGGAADVAAFQIGNGLVGNPPDAVALEIALSGPTLRAECDVSACVFGSPFAIEVSGRAMAAASVFSVRAGETLRIGGTNHGAQAYLCVRGGFHVAPVLGSGSSFEPIREGERLPCDSAIDQGRSLEFADVASLLGESIASLRVIAGSQADWFPPDALYQQSFTVSPASNRMGIRLLGEPIARPQRELISEAVAPGAIQITNDGLPIILGVDGQTIGGYPKIAHVIQADLDRLGQLRPHQLVRFERVPLEAAEALAADRRVNIRRWLAVLRIFAQP